EQRLFGMINNAKDCLAVPARGADLFPLAAGVPVAHLVVLAYRDADFAVRLDGYAVHRILMLREREDRLLRAQVPHLGGLVATAGQQVLAIGGKRDTENPVGMVLDRLLELGFGNSRTDVPDINDAVAATRGKALAVRAGSKAKYRIVCLQQARQQHVLVVDTVEYGHAGYSL